MDEECIREQTAWQHLVHLMRYCFAVCVLGRVVAKLAITDGCTMREPSTYELSAGDVHVFTQPPPQTRDEEH